MKAISLKSYIKRKKSVHFCSEKWFIHSNVAKPVVGERAVSFLYWNILEPLISVTLLTCISVNPGFISNSEGSICLFQYDDLLSYWITSLWIGSLAMEFGLNVFKHPNSHALLTK